MTFESGDVEEVEVTAPVNIALVKYWGKRNEDLAIPLNDSISLNIDELFAKTVIRTGRAVRQDCVSINGSSVDLNIYPRFRRCFAEVRRLLRKRTALCSENQTEKQNFFDKFEVVSETNFPIGAGLASSAAGFAALAYAFGKLFCLDNQDVIRLARLGSGSACRSLFGGLVHWRVGVSADGSDCTCETAFPQDHWQTLRALIIVTSQECKEIPSTFAMRRTVETSELMPFRVREIVPRRIKRCISAFEERDFEELGQLIMNESNQLHAMCMDTTPPIKYLNDVSWHLINVVHNLNSSFSSVRVAYSFDAGSNCCIFTESDFVPILLTALSKYCLVDDVLIEKLAASPSCREWPDLIGLINEEKKRLSISELKPCKEDIKELFVSTVGAAPHLLSRNK